jgi:hypothetical protein
MDPTLRPVADVGHEDGAIAADANGGCGPCVASTSCGCSGCGDLEEGNWVEDDNLPGGLSDFEEMAAAVAPDLGMLVAQGAVSAWREGGEAEAVASDADDMSSVVRNLFPEARRVATSTSRAHCHFALGSFLLLLGASVPLALMGTVPDLGALLFPGASGTRPGSGVALLAATPTMAPVDSSRVTAVVASALVPPRRVVADDAARAGTATESGVATKVETAAEGDLWY